MENSHVFIIMGRSGSGKGTQIELLQKYLSQKDMNTKQQNFVCGDRFREFFKTESFISKHVLDSYSRGEYQPDFFATTLYFSEIFKTINNTDHLFFDGYPRSARQLSDLKELLEYIGKKNAIVIDVSVTADEVIKRIMLRTGRTDDSKSGAEKRQEEFDRAVKPVIDMIKADPFFTYLEIDGMPLPDVVHQNVLNAIKTKI